MEVCATRQGSAAAAAATQNVGSQRCPTWRCESMRRERAAGGSRTRRRSGDARTHDARGESGLAILSFWTPAQDGASRQWGWIDDGVVGGLHGRRFGPSAGVATFPQGLGSSDRTSRPLLRGGACRVPVQRARVCVTTRIQGFSFQTPNSESHPKEAALWRGCQNRGSKTEFLNPPPPSDAIRLGTGGDDPPRALNLLHARAVEAVVSRDVSNFCAISQPHVRSSAALPDIPWLNAQNVKLKDRYI